MKYFLLYLSIYINNFDLNDAVNKVTEPDIYLNNDNVTQTVSIITTFETTTAKTVEDEEEKPKQNLNPTVNDIATELMKILIPDNVINKRITELKEKLGKIDVYQVDRNKFAEIISNGTRHNHFTQTNFYDALIDKEHLLQINNDTTSLFLKLKSKMNRDDILKVLSMKADGQILKSARRMMSGRSSSRKNAQLNEVMDKYLGESPIDPHKYNKSQRFSRYWDPQIELMERKANRRMDGRRIFKGERTSVQYYPFMVSIHVMGRFWCGGAIYSSDIVITSAACLQLMHNNRFFRENPRQLAVRVGSNHSRVGGEMVEALEVYFHPSYNPRTLNNNIALIRLRRHLRFSYHRVPKAIEVYPYEDGIGYTAEVLVLGWGVMKSSQKMAYEPIFLQRKFLPVYPRMFCKEVYGKKFVKETMFCAGTVTTGEGACDHDAGGPAVLNGRLVGVISFGPSICGFPDAPTVFTLAGAYLDWIETIDSSMPSYYMGKRRTTTTTQDPFVEYFKTATEGFKTVAAGKPEDTTNATDGETNAPPPTTTPVTTEASPPPALRIDEPETTNLDPDILRQAAGNDEQDISLGDLAVEKSKNVFYITPRVTEDVPTGANTEEPSDKTKFIENSI